MKNQEQTGSTTLIVIAVVVLVLVASATAYIALKPKNKTAVPYFKADYQDATKPTSGFSTSPLPSVKPEQSVSANDTTDDIEKELDATNIEDDEKDLNELDQMIKQL